MIAGIYSFDVDLCYLASQPGSNLASGSDITIRYSHPTYVFRHRQLLHSSATYVPRASQNDDLHGFSLSLTQALTG